MPMMIRTADPIRSVVLVSAERKGMDSLMVDELLAARPTMPAIAMR